MTEPRTEAKLELADAIADQNLYHGRYGTARAGIAAAAAILAGLRERGWVLVPEAEAAATPAGLDVERLARAIARLDDATTPSDFERRYATDLAREYAALAPDPAAADRERARDVDPTDAVFLRQRILDFATPGAADRERARDAVIAAARPALDWLVRECIPDGSAYAGEGHLWVMNPMDLAHVSQVRDLLRDALAALDHAEGRG